MEVFLFYGIKYLQNYYYVLPMIKLREQMVEHMPIEGSELVTEKPLYTL